jgi:hypothetical protein
MSHPSYLRNLFDAAIVKQSGVLYRRKSDVLIHVTLDELKTEVAQRGFTLMEAGSYFVIICAPRPLVFLV